MTGTIVNGSAEIRWQTAREVNSEGFFIFRLDPSGSNTFIPLTGLIGAQGTNGGSYLFVDNELKANVQYSYLLVERKKDGSLVEYPALIVVLGVGGPEDSQIYLPMVLR